jgi:EF hand
MKRFTWLAFALFTTSQFGIGYSQESEKPKVEAPKPEAREDSRREALRDEPGREGQNRDGREGRRFGEGPGGFERGGQQSREGFPGRLMSRLPIMMALDANQDGEISADEIDLAVVALRKLDKNRDGKLTQDELMPNFDGMGPGGFGTGAGIPGFGPPGFGASGSPDEMVKRLMEADADNDGYLSETELPERMRPMMGRMDSNGDKKISREEIISMGQAARGGRRPSAEGRPTRPQSDK